MKTENMVNYYVPKQGEAHDNSTQTSIMIS